MYEEFKYTHKNDSTDSSLVDGIYYNENTNELAVDLNNQIYVYDGVPTTVYEVFSKAHSKGRFYGQNIKRNYGPSTFLGVYEDVDFLRSTATPAADMSSTFANGGFVTPAQAREGLGMPKNLSYATDATVTNVGVSGGSVSPVRVSGASTTGTSTGPNISLSLDSPTPRRHAVTFEVNGKTKTHNLRAADVDEAVAEVLAIGNMLDIDFTVKEVTVYFE